LKERFVVFLSLVFLFGLFCGVMGSEKEFAKKDSLKFKNYIDQTARKILNHAMKRDGDIYWVTQNKEGKAEESFAFHNGTPGICYFLLKAYAATGERDYLEGARKGMEYLLRQEKNDSRGWYIFDTLNGLFDGNAGRAHLFSYAYRITNEKEYLVVAENLALRILAAPDIGNTSSTDVFTGISGTGLFLLKLYEETNNPVYLKGAEQLGDVLIEKAEPQEKGIRWISKGNETDNYYFLGYAHGTAGRGYFLDRLYRLSKKEIYREYADKAMAHLADLAVLEKGYVKWPRDEVQGMNRFPSQWCHGAPGMNAFFLELYERTKDKKYLDLAEKNTLFLLDQGVNVRKNGCVCHGISGNTAALYAAYKTTGNSLYLEETMKAVVLLDDTVIKDPDGYYWDSLMGKDDYGYHSGLAGIGDFFVFLFSNGKIPMMGGLGYGDDL
jgi:lantibiotic modifying enzyme